MDDSTSAAAAVEGILLIVSSFATIPTGIVTGATALAGALGWIFGTKHEQKRERKRQEKDFIQQILDSKEADAE